MVFIPSGGVAMGPCGRGVADAEGALAARPLPLGGGRPDPWRCSAVRAGWIPTIVAFFAVTGLI